MLFRSRLGDDVLDDPEIATRVSQYEMAFKMQASVPELMDLSGESRQTLEMYGTGGADGSFAANCLLARRLAERGVRFIQVYHRAWDHHGGIKKNVEVTAEIADGWIPVFFHPDKAESVWGEALGKGNANRDPSLGPLEVVAGGALAICDDDTARQIRDAGQIGRAHV